MIKKALFLVAVFAFFGGLVWLHLLSRGESEREAEASISAPSKIVARDGATPIIELSEEVVAAAAIEAKPVAITNAQAQLPSSSLVRDNGREWVYFKLSTNQYARAEVEPISTSERGSWRFKASIPASPVVVTQGAQTLLSEELKSEIKVGED